MKYYCDNKRHLICIPYTRENLHAMAKDLQIKKCWFHTKPYDHYDIPFKRIDEITAKCTLVSDRDIIRLIKNGEVPER